MTLKDRYTLLTQIAQAYGVQQARQALKNLAEADIPAALGSYEKAKANQLAQERELRRIEDHLAAGLEGKNEMERRAALVQACEADPNYVTQKSLVNSCVAATIDAEIAWERLKRQWIALTVQLNLFQAAINFLAGGSDASET